MLALISPAKKLDFESEPTFQEHSFPDFLKQSEKLINSAKKLSRAEIGSMMKISDKLADLNYNRYHSFKLPFHLGNAKQAAWVFNGDTYLGLEAKTLNDDDMAFAQDSLRILSGLYGLLRPLDLIQPYRLEMGAKFTPPKGGDLYGYWDQSLSNAINLALVNQSDKTVINLASNEYFKVIKTKLLSGPIITPVFKETKNGSSKTLGMFAKRARGSMARYIIKNRLTSPEGLKQFNTGGYKYQESVSDNTTWVFTRPQPAPVNAKK